MSPMDSGVLRHIIDFRAGNGPEVQDVELALTVEADDEDTLGEVVFYTLSEDRLRDLLRLAAAGGDVEGLVLSVDAAALIWADDDGGDEKAL